MKKTLLILWLCLSMACAHTQEEKPTAKPTVAQSPLKVEVAPTCSFGGETAWFVNFVDDPRFPPFHVILTNISKSNQAVYEEGNSWGWQNLSFEFRTADGTTFITTKRPTSFTKNNPDTFIIFPGEHMVFPVHLNPFEWETRPALKENGDFPVTFKAVYQIPNFPDGGAPEAWVGRVESREYKLTIRHFESEPGKGSPKKFGGL